MKMICKFLAVSFILSILVMPSVYADSSEKAKVIKFDKDQSDLIIERQNGEQWLIQHSPMCNSITTEFPVTLILDSRGKILYVKKDFNEKCKVFNASPYSGRAEITRVIRSENPLVTNYQAEIIWSDIKYFIHYDSRRCRFLKDFLDERVYMYLPEGELTGSQMILPGNRGQCEIDYAKPLYSTKKEEERAPDMLNGIDHQVQNNQVYFYWERPDAAGRFLNLISYSKYPVNPDNYDYWEMPNLKRTLRNSYTIKLLKNDRLYYFYLASLNAETRQVSAWTEIQATPVGTESFKNDPDPEQFEIDIEDTGDNFRLYWPAKDNVRRYYVKFYVNGKQEFLKLLKSTENELLIPKKPEYLNKRLRLTVRIIQENAYGHGLYDGHFWVYREEE